MTDCHVRLLLILGKLSYILGLENIWDISLKDGEPSKPVQTKALQRASAMNIGNI